MLCCVFLFYCLLFLILSTSVKRKVRVWYNLWILHYFITCFYLRVFYGIYTCSLFHSWPNCSYVIIWLLMCVLYYTFTLFKSSNTAMLPILNFHFVIVTRPAVSLKTLCMFARCFHTFNYILFSKHLLPVLVRKCIWKVHKLFRNVLTNEITS